MQAGVIVLVAGLSLLLLSRESCSRLTRPGQMRLSPLRSIRGVGHHRAEVGFEFLSAHDMHGEVSETLATGSAVAPLRIGTEKEGLWGRME